MSEDVANDKMRRIDSCPMVGANTLGNRLLPFIEKPCATNLALYLATVPSAFVLTLNIQRHPTIFAPRGRGTNSHTPCCSMECSSLEIASCHSTGWGRGQRVL